MNSKIKEFLRKTHIINMLSIYQYFFRIFKIDNNKIFCVNFNGKGYGDNPKYIVEELLSQNENYNIIWSIDKKTDKNLFPQEIKTVKLYSFSFFYHLSTAKVWISNVRFSSFIRKRKEQKYIQTWHGSIAMKKIEYDAMDKLSKDWKDVMLSDVSKTDYMISNSKFCNDMYRRAFKYNGEILEFGSPRNDILFKNSEKIKKKICEQYCIDNNEKILLYVPTFRNSYEKNPYDIDFIRLQAALDNLKDKWRIIVKFHPIMNYIPENVLNNKKIVNASNYPDVQELISICDLLITDYSSTMFEAMIANKPVILYTSDFESYENERGYYFKLEELPFKKAKNNNELMLLINEKELVMSSIKYDEFKKRLGLKEDGKASKRVAKLIQKIVREEV